MLCLAYLSPQCILPCLEGLIPGTLGDTINDLVWNMAVWHALAKLRLHRETTIQILEAATSSMGAALRAFKRACASVDTRELPGEVAARGRRTAAKAAVNGTVAAPVLGKNHKAFNDKTFKMHGLGYVPQDVREVGPTDVYSTQAVSATDSTEVSRMLMKQP